MGGGWPICRLQRGLDPELGFARDIGPSWWRRGEGWGARPARDACLGVSLRLATSDAPKDRLLERDGKSLDVGSNRFSVPG